MRTSERVLSRDVLLVVADGCLLASHRLSEWVSRAPTMEEDVAIGNIALDLLGQARGLLSSLGDEDALAYLRDAVDFRNPLICELPNGDFAHTVVRQLLLTGWLQDVWHDWSQGIGVGGDDGGVGGGGDVPVRGVAEKAVKEVAYHWRHWSAWARRLGDGTAESHDRMVTALDALWPLRAELQPESRWLERVVAVLQDATLSVPSDRAPVLTGGTDGRHTSHLPELLAEMQSVARAHPGASW